MKNLYNEKEIHPLTLNSFADILPNDESVKFISFFGSSPEKKGHWQETGKQLKNEVDIEIETRKVFEDAYKEGEKAGFEIGMKKVEPLIRRLNGDIAALSAFKEELYKKAEEMSIELALVFAEAIVLQECTINRDIVLNMAKKALEICEEKHEITIRIRRDDIRYISEDAMSSLKVIPDDTLKDPGFIIESNFGAIDGTIAAQIEELKKEFCKEYADR